MRKFLTRERAPFFLARTSLFPYFRFHLLSALNGMERAFFSCEKEYSTLLLPRTFQAVEEYDETFKVEYKTFIDHRKIEKRSINLQKKYPVCLANQVLQLGIGISWLFSLAS